MANNKVKNEVDALPQLVPSSSYASPPPYLPRGSVRHVPQTPGKEPAQVAASLERKRRGSDIGKLTNDARSGHRPNQPNR
jgi:hypothetical protein